MSKEEKEKCETKDHCKCLVHCECFKKFLIVTFGSFIGVFFAESGPRMYHYNLGWGIIIADGLLYAASYYLWYWRVRSIIHNKVIINKKSMISKVITVGYCTMGSILLVYLIIVGLYYFIILCAGFANYGI